MTNFNAVGRLEYSDRRAVVWIDKGIVDFYLSMIPKAHYVRPQMYPAHITVVRTGIETPKNQESWKKYEGELVEFVYSNEIQHDGWYYWLNCQSDRIGAIREELGLTRYRIGGYRDYQEYHITIGNIKDRLK